jgi:hypothetical protein
VCLTVIESRRLAQQLIDCKNRMTHNSWLPAPVLEVFFEEFVYVALRRHE